MDRPASLQSTLANPRRRVGRTVPWEFEGVSLVISNLTSAQEDFVRAWKRKGRKPREKVATWLRTSLGALQPLVETHVFYCLTLTVWRRPDAYEVLNRAVVALQRCEPLADCLGAMVRHGGDGVLPNTHVLLASPRRLTAKEIARAKALGRRHAGGWPDVREIYLRDDREVRWRDLDPEQRQLALECTLLYFAREILRRSPAALARQRRRFEHFAGKRVERPPVPPRFPDMRMPKVTKRPFPLCGC